MGSKKGMEMSISVIIVAVLALVILVVLLAIFMGKITVFEKGVSKEAQTELIKMKITYGDCHPSASAETSFTSDLSKTEVEGSKELIKSNFKDAISSCKSTTEKANCGGSCQWN
jgi:hypothetical protein